MLERATKHRDRTYRRRDRTCEHSESTRVTLRIKGMSQLLNNNVMREAADVIREGVCLNGGGVQEADALCLCKRWEIRLRNSKQRTTEDGTSDGGTVFLVTPLLEDVTRIGTQEQVRNGQCVWRPRTLLFC